MSTTFPADDPGAAPASPTGSLVVLSTAPDSETARSLARVLVEERLAACVNQVSGVESVYSWNDEICHDAEVLLIVKTTAERYAELARRLLELHPYDEPELVALPIVAGSAGYLAWLANGCLEPPASD